MEVYKDSMPVFRYNTSIFPTYGVIPGHWYMLFYSVESCTSSSRMVSLITESQQDILTYFETSDLVDLHFIPSPDSN